MLLSRDDHAIDEDPQHNGSIFHHRDQLSSRPILDKIVFDVFLFKCDL